jgi:hypothetical protein
MGYFEVYCIDGKRFFPDHILQWNPAENNFILEHSFTGNKRILQKNEINRIEQISGDGKNGKGIFEIKYGLVEINGQVEEYSKKITENGNLLLGNGKYGNDILQIGNHPFWLYEKNLEYVRGR